MKGGGAITAKAIREDKLLLRSGADHDGHHDDDDVIGWNGSGRPSVVVMIGHREGQDLSSYLSRGLDRMAGMEASEWPDLVSSETTALREKGGGCDGGGGSRRYSKISTMVGKTSRLHLGNGTQYHRLTLMISVLPS